MNQLVLVRLFVVVAIIVAIGTIFFRWVEGWSWLDAYFFTVVTLSTVGYGSLVPTTVVGKLATTVLIFLGLTVFALAIQQFSQITLMNRINQRAKLREARTRMLEAEKRATAAEERGPDA